MNKRELIDAVAHGVGLPKGRTKDVIESVIETITTQLHSGQPVNIAGFGVFELRERAPRKQRNPKTGEPMVVPAKAVPSFKSCKSIHLTKTAEPKGVAKTLEE